MSQVCAHPASYPQTRTSVKVAAAAWGVAAVYYFFQYALRSAPSVMMPQLSEAFGVNALEVASIAGLFYYGYSPFSLVAGAAMDWLGPRKVLPIAAVVVGVGALLFATGNNTVASVGRFLQGAGGVFALVGAIYIATKNFPPSQAATLIGATQMFGMAGGSAGQFVVGPLIAGGLVWSHFWFGTGIVGLVVGGLLLLLLPEEKRHEHAGGGLRNTTDAFWTVFKNPQSILCGVIAGLLFIPTTIFDMIWGVRYLQEAHGLDYASAVMRSAAVPFGWIIGCPVLGFISDRLGRRKPVIIGGAVLLFACLAWILFGHVGVFPPYILGLLAGLASGAAMLPYTVIKEANPSQLGGDSNRRDQFSKFHFQCAIRPSFWMGSSVPLRRSQLTSSGALPDGFCAASIGRCRRNWPLPFVERDRPRNPNIAV